MRKATVVYVEHADGAAEPVVALGSDRASIEEALSSVRVSLWSDAYRLNDELGRGWVKSTRLDSGMRVDKPTSASDVPEKVRQCADVVGDWQPTHRVLVGNEWRFICAPLDGQDGPAPTLREYLLARTSDAQPADPEMGRRGGVWTYFGGAHPGAVEPVDGSTVTAPWQGGMPYAMPQGVVQAAAYPGQPVAPRGYVPPTTRREAPPEAHAPPDRPLTADVAPSAAGVAPPGQAAQPQGGSPPQGLQRGFAPGLGGAEQAAASPPGGQPTAEQQKAAEERAAAEKAAQGSSGSGGKAASGGKSSSSGSAKSSG